MIFLTEHDPLGFVDQAVIGAMYVIPLVCLLLWPRATLAFLAMLFVWQVGDGGDGWLWPFLLLFGVGVLYNIRAVWRWLRRSLPGARA